MTNLKTLAFGVAAICLTACTTVTNDMDMPKASVTQNGDQFTVSAPINSFSDFILIETQLGNVAPRVVDMDTVVADLAGYDAIFIGEAHGHAASHYVQSKIFSGLHAKYADMTLSMEQFERSQQGVVDDYLAGKIGEETLIHDGKAWPHYRSSYRPLVEFAKTNGLPVIASEIPGNMVSCIGERGPDFLNTLKGEPRSWAADKLHLEDGAYKDKYYAFLAAVPSHSVGGDESEAEKEKKRFYRYAAQVSRDDTMAESIANHMKANPGRKVMHIDGSFHSAGLLGTPERLEIRIPGVKMANVHPIIVDDPKNPTFNAKDVGEGQYLLLIYPVPKRFVQMKNISAFIARTKDKIDENRCVY
ncbi:MAG: ChaN family lipoprotein [Robiginitomaculum sp.]|nr:ChaN family lipoprotein [Robiginitomaculum sp.]